MTTEKTDNTDKIDKIEKNRDFGRRGVYSQKNYGYDNENRFKFKNSLVITPNYEIEFNASGGVKYIRNHEDRLFFTNAGIFATTNNIRKMPVLIKRGINKQSVRKKLIVEEKYNYEEKYEIDKNIILYYDENRVDYQIFFNKTDGSPNIKDITAEFFLSLTIPGIDDIVTYKKYNAKQEYKSFLSKFQNNQINQINPGDPDISGDNLEYIVVGCGKRSMSCMTLYPDRRLLTEYRDKTLCFITPNISHPQKNYINLKIYLENYRIT